MPSTEITLHWRQETIIIVALSSSFINSSASPNLPQGSHHVPGKHLGELQLGTLKPKITLFNTLSYCRMSLNERENYNVCDGWREDVCDPEQKLCMHILLTNDVLKKKRDEMRCHNRCRNHNFTTKRFGYCGQPTLRCCREKLIGYPPRYSSAVWISTPSTVFPIDRTVEGCRGHMVRIAQKDMPVTMCCGYGFSKVFTSWVSSSAPALVLDGWGMMKWLNEG